MSSPQPDTGLLSLSRLVFQGGSYDGLAICGLPHSFGVLKSADGSRFVGEWEMGNFILGQATRPGSLKCTGEVRKENSQTFVDFLLSLTRLVQFNDNYQLHGLGSSVNFLGVSQDGNYHKDVFKVRLFLSFVMRFCAQKVQFSL